MTFLGAEQDLVDRWVEEALIANTAFDGISAGLTSRIYNMYAPPEVPTPFLLFQAQSPVRDIRGVGTARVMVDTLYVVKAIAQGANFHALGALAVQIDLSMTRAAPVSVTGTDGWVLGSVREEGFSMVEVEAGKQFRSLGGVYRIHAQAAV